MNLEHPLSNNRHVLPSVDTPFFQTSSALGDHIVHKDKVLVQDVVDGGRSCRVRLCVLLWVILDELQQSMKDDNTYPEGQDRRICSPKDARGAVRTNPTISTLAGDNVVDPKSNVAEKPLVVELKGSWDNPVKPEID